MSFNSSLLDSRTRTSRGCCTVILLLFSAAAWLNLRVLLASLHVRCCSLHTADLSCFSLWFLLRSLCCCMLSTAVEGVKKTLRSWVQISPSRAPTNSFWPATNQTQSFFFYFLKEKSRILLFFMYLHVVSCPAYMYVVLVENTKSLHY